MREEKRYSLEEVRQAILACRECDGFGCHNCYWAAVILWAAEQWEQYLAAKEYEDYRDWGDWDELPRSHS